MLTGPLWRPCLLYEHLFGSLNNNFQPSSIGIAIYYFFFPMTLENAIFSSVKRQYATCLLFVDSLFLVDFVNEQFQEALGRCVTLSHSVIDIDATWITEQYNLFCTVSIDLVQ